MPPIADSGEPYRNRGVHVVRLRWFTIVDVDTEVLRSALDRQAVAGIDEATAAPIIS